MTQQPPKSVAHFKSGHKGLKSNYLTTYTKVVSETHFVFDNVTVWFNNKTFITLDALS